MRMESCSKSDTYVTVYTITVEPEDRFYAYKGVERKRLLQLNPNMLSHVLEGLTLLARAGEREAGVTIGKDGKLRLKKKKKG